MASMVVTKQTLLVVLVTTMFTHLTDRVSMGIYLYMHDFLCVGTVGMYYNNVKCLCGKRLCAFNGHVFVYEYHFC